MKVLKFPGVEQKPAPKQSLRCKLTDSYSLNKDIFQMDFEWEGPAPRAGQFFMIKPRRGAFFLGRPISVAIWDPPTVSFFITGRGKGTKELFSLRRGELAELTGPLGNAWTDFLSVNRQLVALVGGGVGIAPLGALADELPEMSFDFYAGFKNGFENSAEQMALVGQGFFHSNNTIIATEDGSTNKDDEPDSLNSKIFRKGRIPDFLEPKKYRAVCACGPEPMLKAVAARCKAAEVPCFVSLERRMACGVGACLGCTVPTIHGNRRCCADGPIFPAEELIFNE
jgi:NAD(P)H-flavin reductase